jgi:hypothetical protein
MGILSSEHLIKPVVRNNRLETLLTSREKYGFSELFSQMYMTITIGNLLNLYDFTKNPMIKKKSKNLLDKVSMELLSAVDLNGNIFVASTRMYSEDRERNGKTHCLNKFVEFLFHNKQSRSLKKNSNKTSIIEPNFLDIYLDTTKYIYNGYYPLFPSDFIVQNLPIPSYEETWIHWSYGKYFDKELLSQNLQFFHDHHLKRYHDFIKIGSIMEIFFYIYKYLPFFRPIMHSVLFLSKIDKIADLSNTKIKIHRYQFDQEFLIISYFKDHQLEGIPNAQQWPFMMNLNGEPIYFQYGTIYNDGPEREMNSIAVFPQISAAETENGSLKVTLSFFTRELLYMYNNRFSVKISNPNLNDAHVSIRHKNRWTVEIQIIP